MSKCLILFGRFLVSNHETLTLKMEKSNYLN